MGWSAPRGAVIGFVRCARVALSVLECINNSCSFCVFTIVPFILVLLGLENLSKKGVGGTHSFHIVDTHIYFALMTTMSQFDHFKGTLL